MVDLRAARPEAHLEPVLGIDPGGDGLIEAAMLGLGLPIGAEADLVEGAGGRGGEDCGEGEESGAKREAAASIMRFPKRLIRCAL